MADGIRRGETAIEVDAFDDGVHAQDFEPVGCRLDNRRIVPDADDEPGRGGRKLCLNPCDELGFGEIGDGGASIWRNPPRGFPG